MTFLQVDQSNFSISFDLHMWSINTLPYGEWCLERPRASLHKNESKKNLGPPVNCQPSHWRRGSQNDSWRKLEQIKNIEVSTILRFRTSTKCKQKLFRKWTVMIFWGIENNQKWIRNIEMWFYIELAIFENFQKFEKQWD